MNIYEGTEKTSETGIFLVRIYMIGWVHDVRSLDL